MKKFAALILVIFTLTAFSMCKEERDYLAICKTQIAKYNPPRKDYVIVIDYTKSISAKRLYVIEVKTGKVVINDFVSHSLMSGILHPNDTSSVVGSNKTVTGTFLTQEKFTGELGLGMRIKGLDSFNKNTRDRNIVFHKMIYIPYSLGCFATPDETNTKLINLTNGGCLVVVIK